MAKKEQEWKVVYNAPNYEMSRETLEVRNINTQNIVETTQNRGIGRHTKNYYRSIALMVDGKAKHFYVHRLVKMTFDPVKNMNRLTVDHLDGVKNHNDLENLDWCTLKENIRRGVERRNNA